MNYQKLLEEELLKIENNKNIPKLLLHACCAPCSSYVLEYLSNYFNITLYYYNPNIHPEEEYKRRLNELENFITRIKTKNKIELVIEDYNTNDYFESIKGFEHLGEKTRKCYMCYKFRMKKAALYAKENNFDYFTTTLSISPYKNASWLNEIGINLENKLNIKYLYADFKKKNGYKRSLELSKKYGLYRQQYCGCMYSKKHNELKITNR